MPKSNLWQTHTNGPAIPARFGTTVRPIKRRLDSTSVFGMTMQSPLWIFSDIRNRRGEMKKTIVEILKAILAIILAVILFFLSFAVTASIRLEQEAARSEIEMEARK